MVHSEHTVAFLESEGDVRTTEGHGMPSRGTRPRGGGQVYSIVGVEA